MRSHVHQCQVCGCVWTCSDPGCWPFGEDQCRSCEMKQADDWWSDVELQRQLLNEQAERQQPRLEY